MMAYRNGLASVAPTQQLATVAPTQMKQRMISVQRQMASVELQAAELNPGGPVRMNFEASWENPDGYFQVKHAFKYTPKAAVGQCPPVADVQPWPESPRSYCCSYCGQSDHVAKRGGMIICPKWRQELGFN